MAQALGTAFAPPLQAPARLDTIEVTVGVDLQRRRWVLCRPARSCRLRSRKAQLDQIKLVDEGVDRTDRIVFRNPVLKLLWKQYALRPLFPRDESAQPQPRQVDLPTLTADESKSLHTAIPVDGGHSSHCDCLRLAR